MRSSSGVALQRIADPAERAAADRKRFLEHEREVLIRRWKLFAPVVFVLFGLTEGAAWITPEFPKSPIITGVMLTLMAGVYVLARLNPSRSLIGLATVVTGLASAAYVGTAAADTGRFHSQQILAMAVLVAVVPGILSFTLTESIVTLGGGVVVYLVVCRLWNVTGPVDYTGLATGVIYLVFIVGVTVLSSHSNRGLRFREFLARREVERVHRFAVEEVLNRHLPPGYVERVLSGAHPLDSPPERRTVTVIFADIVSFTPLSEALRPEELAGLMAHFYDVTAQIAFANGATIDKFIGDAVMAILGAPEPMTPELPARNAVEVARGWHRAVANLDGRRLALRIGIHQDVVAVGAFGGKLRSDYTVLGRGVNIAARLEQRCRPGEIVISSEVHQWLDASTLDARELGEVELKGIPTPVRCWALNGPGDRGTVPA